MERVDWEKITYQTPIVRPANALGAWLQKESIVVGADSQEVQKIAERGRTWHIHVRFPFAHYVCFAEAVNAEGALYLPENACVYSVAYWGEASHVEVPERPCGRTDVTMWDAWHPWEPVHLSVPANSKCWVLCCTGGEAIRLHVERAWNCETWLMTSPERNHFVPFGLMDRWPSDHRQAENWLRVAENPYDGMHPYIASRDEGDR